MKIKHALQKDMNSSERRTLRSESWLEKVFVFANEDQHFTFSSSLEGRL